MVPVEKKSHNVYRWGPFMLDGSSYWYKFLLLMNLFWNTYFKNLTGRVLLVMVKMNGSCFSIN